MRKTFVATVGTILTLVVGATPAAASIHWSSRGTVGPHSIADSVGAASVRCNYQTVSVEDDPGDSYIWRGKLSRLEVRPPKVWAISGTQRVAWRFSVQRAVNASSTLNDEWSTIYRSGIQTASATPLTRARFTPMYTPISVPAPSSDRTYSYRVMVRIIWYRDGHIQGTVRHLLSYYEVFFKEAVEVVRPPWCDARISYWLPDERSS